jgi:TolB-like protein
MPHVARETEYNVGYLIKYIWPLIILFIALGLACNYAHADTPNMGQGMRGVAEEFAKDVEGRHEIKPTLAIFPFQVADPKLAEKGMGMAVVEILTKYLLQTGKFTLVERAELLRILEEQRLGLTGVIESSTAVKVGQILGSRLVVLGTIVKLGGSYQVSARLIDVETSEVLSIGFVEVEQALFEEQTKPYLTLVPEKQVIGIFIAFHSSYNDSFEESTGAYLGFRYFPVKSFFVELMLGQGGGSQIGQTKFVDTGGAFANDLSTIDYIVTQEQTIAASINYNYHTSDKLNAFIGAGLLASSYKLDVTRYNTVNNMANLYPLTTSEKYVLAFLTTGIEYRPQERFGISLSYDHFFGHLPEFVLTNKTGPGPFVYQQVTVYAPELSSSNYRVMASLYF